jgi:4-hydroxyphenylacetate 3-monooxygenase
MAIRTGVVFLRSLRDGRQIWIDGEHVGDVTIDRRFSGVAQSMPELYDVQHDPKLRDQLTTSLRQRATVSASLS